MGAWKIRISREIQMIEANEVSEGCWRVPQSLHWEHLCDILNQESVVSGHLGAGESPVINKRLASLI